MKLKAIYNYYTRYIISLLKLRLKSRKLVEKKGKRERESVSLREGGREFQRRIVDGKKEFLKEVF